MIPQKRRFSEHHNVAVPLIIAAFSSNFGIEVFNNQIVVAGGYGGTVGTIREVEAYDFRANSWTELPMMNLRRSAVYLTRIDHHDVIEAFVLPNSTDSE